MKSLSLALAVTFLATVPHLRAEVRLPALISDDMVLQQELPANVWGWASPNEKVSVSLAGRSASTTAGEDGRWKVKLGGLVAGAAGDMTIQGANTLTVHNVAVGEVWICSGQSNMEMVVAGVDDAEKEVAASESPLVRMFTVARSPRATPQEECGGKWELAAPVTTGHFSAVGYFFGRQVAAALQVPVGLIHASWGGTPAEYWTPADALAAEHDFKGTIDAWARIKSEYPQAKARFDEELAKWEAARTLAKTDGRPEPARPSEPSGKDDLGAPGCLYNGMIAPLLGYTIRGATWYQGESNASAATQYTKLFPLMILSWRERWGLPEFPFLFVQLANFMPQEVQPGDSDWARLREAQLQTLRLKNTGMAVAIDIGDEKDIHPKNKQEVGRRLALNALATVYQREMEYSGPLPLDVQAEEGKLRITWRYPEGLKTTDGGAPKGFAVAGEDQKFHWAKAEIQGDHVIVQSDQVSNPVAVRYGWANNPAVNLVNGAGLPASPFRSDDWPKDRAPNPR